MPERIDHLRAVLDSSAALRHAEEQAARMIGDARERFRDSLREAHKAGISYAELGRIVGLTRQRVYRIASGD